MAFTLRKLKHRPWPVAVKLLSSDDEGNVTEAGFEFVIHFKPFSEAEIKALSERTLEADKKPPAEGAETANAERSIADLLERNVQFFAPLIDGWSKVNSEDGAPLPYTDETLHAMVTGPDGMAISAGIHAALRELRFGVAPAKNSLPSVAPGLVPAAVEAPTNSPATLAPLV